MSSEQSNIVKRQIQISMWFDSDTEKASKSIKDADKIKFTKEVQFFSACNSNDWHEIERLLKEGININCTQDDGLSSLHQACIDDDEPLVKYLINHGAEMDAQDKDGWTPLFAAVSCNFLPITKYLISCGARLDIVSFEGELAIDQSNNEIITQLLKEEMRKNNLDPDEIKNREKYMMLNDVEVMKKTKNYSKFTLVDNGGSLLHIAASKDYVDVLEKLLEIISPQQLNHVDNDGWNALHVAAYYGNRKACVLLVNADIDFETVTTSNQTVLEVSDDDVKPYIREEIRKARFRRQERASVKRPAESPSVEYQPSETKIICQDKTSPPPVENQQQSNGDRHTESATDQTSELLSDSHSIIETTDQTADSQNSADTALKSNEVDVVCGPAQFQNIVCPESTLKSPFANVALTVAGDDTQHVNDTKSPKVAVPSLTANKTLESESQRKDKARHVRSTRRSTQGITAEDIGEANKLMTHEKADSFEKLSSSIDSNGDKIAKSMTMSNHTNEKCGVSESLQDTKNESQIDGCLPKTKNESQTKVPLLKTKNESQIDGCLLKTKNESQIEVPLLKTKNESPMEAPLPRTKNESQVEVPLPKTENEVPMEVPLPKTKNDSQTDVCLPKTGNAHQAKVPLSQIHDLTSKSCSPSNDLPAQCSDLSDVIISDSNVEGEKKGRAVSQAVSRRRTRDRPPTGTVDPKDIQAAHDAHRLSEEQSKITEADKRKEPETDYKALYENELKEMEKLQRNLTKLREDIELSEDRVRRLESNHVAPKLQTSSILPTGYQLKEMEKLREENKKMKEANSALIRVISRLSHPSSKLAGGSN